MLILKPDYTPWNYEISWTGRLAARAKQICSAHLLSAKFTILKHSHHGMDFLSLLGSRKLKEILNKLNTQKKELGQVITKAKQICSGDLLPAEI